MNLNVLIKGCDVSIIKIHACIMLSLGRIPISAHVVANPSGMILLYLVAPFFTPKVFCIG